MYRRRPLSAAVTFGPDVCPLHKHVAEAGGLPVLQVVLELRAGRADMVDHVLQAHLHTHNRHGCGTGRGDTRDTRQLG